MIVLGVEMGTTEIGDVSGVVVGPVFVVARLVTGVLDTTPSERLTHNKSVQLKDEELVREDVVVVLSVPVILFMLLELRLVKEVDPVFAVLDGKMPELVVTDDIEDVDVTPALVDGVFGEMLLRVVIAFVEAGGVVSVEVAGLVLGRGLRGFEADVVDPNETEDVDEARAVLGMLLVGIEVRTVGADKVSGVGIADVGLDVILLEPEMVAVGAKDVDVAPGAHCLFMIKFTPRRKEHAGGLDEFVSTVEISKFEDVVEMPALLDCVGNTFDVTLGALVVLGLALLLLILAGIPVPIDMAADEVRGDRVEVGVPELLLDCNETCVVAIDVAGVAGNESDTPVLGLDNVEEDEDDIVKLVKTESELPKLL
ncbi:hypothetical protein N7G274_001636 [Stereocaulon virgatum]|uniref:Uncharacterized protein n=1 Tax=Stereocaulon virgatum TaxID=373712 RepID=A0ABR4ANC9_9LECA